MIAVSKDMLAELLASPPPRLERLGVEHVLDDASYDAIAVAFPRLKTLWIPEVDVDVQIQRVAAFLKRRALDFEIVLRCDGGSLVPLAPWLLAVRAELAPLREVTLLIHGGPFVRATAGEHGLRLHLSIPHLHWVRDLLPALAPIEHVKLTLTPGSPPPSDIRRLYDRLLAPLPDVAVAEVWRAALASEP